MDADEADMKALAASLHGSSFVIPDEDDGGAASASATGKKQDPGAASASATGKKQDPGSLFKILFSNVWDKAKAFGLLSSTGIQSHFVG